ncbi:MAG: purine-nucleoside phosphorylase [Deltaproteobacteria bacterium]
MENETQSVVTQRAVEAVREAVPGAQPTLGIVLGSGLGGLVDGIEIAGTVAYDQIPGFRTSTVEGHAGRLVIGTLQGVPVVAMQGRVHLYEGYPASEVVFPIRVMVRLGAKRLIVTNAAGGVNPDFDEKEIMLISDHLNLTGTNPLLGPNDMALGPRFPDMTDPYDAELRQVAREVAESIDLTLREGVYAGLLGPSYETPAEVRMLGRLGADAVGMSTVLEVIAARHMGASVLGLSCISNKGAGLAAGPLSHDEVKAAGAAVQEDFIALVSKIVARLG